MPYTEKQERFFHARGISHSHDFPILKRKKINKAEMNSLVQYGKEYAPLKRKLSRLGKIKEGDAIVISELSPYMKNTRVVTIFHTGDKNYKPKPIVKVGNKEYVIS